MMWTKALFICLSVELLAGRVTAATRQIWSGNARAIDGDSLNVGQTEVRLFGIDAPEFSQTCTRNGQLWRCGEESAHRLSKLVFGKQVRCSSMGTDQHGRTLGRCSVGPVDINRQMVALGYAVAYRRYSLEYGGAENSAKLARRGLWSGTFTMPSDYRHAEEQGVRETPVRSGRASAGHKRVASPSTCTIKGNRGSNGWIYHLPGMPYYDRTRAEEMFCTEAQAQAAGFRRAKAR